MLPRILFVISELPRAEVSVRRLLQGQEALSGSVSSSVLVASALARRGHRVGMFVLEGQRLVDGELRGFADLGAALAWCDGGPVIWCSWGDEDTAAALTRAGARPWMWSHVHVEQRWRRQLERGALQGIVTVSDAARVRILHSPAYRRIGRVHNPLNPAFATEPADDPDRYTSAAVVFSGHPGPNKGAHRVLQMWPELHARLPHATLTLAGSTRLYGARQRVGRFGVAAPEFEERYLQPLVERSGSLEAAGVRLLGLVLPAELRALFRRSALGLVNFNWEETETFCCAAVEMLASGLPVLSFARGALPESIGSTGGAVLLRRPALQPAAERIAELLARPDRLRAMGRAGAASVRQRYDLERIADQWEALLAGGAENLDRASGRWRAQRNARYFIARSAGPLRLGRAIDAGLRLVHRSRRR